MLIRLIICIFIYLNLSYSINNDKITNDTNSKEITNEITLSYDNNLVINNNINNNIYKEIYRYATYAALSYSTKLNQIKLGNLQNACDCILCKDSTFNCSVEKIYIGIVSSVLFIDHSNNEIILSIKGTTSNDEWIMDFKIIPINYHSLTKNLKIWEKYFKYNNKCKGCLIHKGFHDGSVEIFNAMFESILKLSNNYPNYSIIITGHSLGGAIAPLIGNELRLLNKKSNVISFGSPKFGNIIFQKWMNKLWNTNENLNDLNNLFKRSSYIRVTHKDDIVPLLPIRQMNYKHSGINIHFNVNKNPMEVHHMQIKEYSEPFIINSNFSIVTNNNKINDKWKLQFNVKSHKDYMMRMNMCVLK